MGQACSELRGGQFPSAFKAVNMASPVSPTPAPVTIGIGSQSSSSAQGVVTSNALSAIFGRIKDYAGTVVKQQKPWQEVLDRSTISKPSNFSEALSRIKKNAAYFRVNYLLVMLTTCVVTFVMHPSSLFVLGALLGGWIYLVFVRRDPIVIGGRQLSEREKVMGMSALSFITIFFLTSVGTVFFSALSISLAVILAHGAMREPDNLFVDDASQESQQSLLNIFSVPSSGVANAV